MLLKNFKWSLLGIGFLLLSMTWQTLYFRDFDQNKESEHVYQTFHEKERKAASVVHAISEELQKPLGKAGFSLSNSDSDPEKEGLFYTIQRGDSLVYWSSALVTFGTDDNYPHRNDGLRRFPTGWFYQLSKQQGDYIVCAYILIKRCFPYQNQYLHSAFQEDFHLPEQWEPLISKDSADLIITRPGGEYVFGFQFNGYQLTNRQATYISVLFFFLFVLFLTVQVFSILKMMRRQAWFKLMLATIYSMLAYLLITGLRWPESLFAQVIFSPHYFAYNKYLGSLGDYLLLSIFLFFLAHCFFTFYRKVEPKSKSLTWFLFLHLLATAYFLLSMWLFQLLLRNSTITPEVISNLKISIPNVLASLCLSLQILGFGIILLRIRCLYYQSEKVNYFLYFSLGTLTAGLLLLFLANESFSIFVWILYLTVLFSLYKIGSESLVKYKLSTLLLFCLISAFFMNLNVQHELSERRAKVQKVMAVNLATERDPAAEIFLTEFEEKIRKDSVIQSNLTPPFRNLDIYLRNNYFTGFWKNYELQVTVCEGNDSVFLPEEQRRFPCLEFFNQLKLSKGVLIPGTDFYFMDRLNGRISYLGELQLMQNRSQKKLEVFIELNSKNIPEGKGYPQLLLDQQAIKNSGNQGFSYSKYFDNKLVNRGGVYPYELTFPTSQVSDSEFSYFKSGGFDHCVFKRNKDNIVIVSYPILTWFDKVRSFPPLFIILFLIGFVWMLVNRKWQFIPLKKMDLRGKIQFTLVFTLLAILLLIGIGLVQYNYFEFRKSLKETLEQRVRAISAELGLRVGITGRLGLIGEYLNVQLLEISEITWTDINVYDLNGKLVATSREEIFEQGLTSDRMNPVAFRALKKEGNSVFLHNETLGKMAFFSIYAPLFNQDNIIIGYLNLPYFNRQDEFTNQVSGFIEAFINLYIFLIVLTLVVALLVSSKLTVPLLLIEQKLQGISLGKENAKIEYTGEDEIGRLVNAYNAKVDELSESVALLAKSERESAWKEMARQIAHEINNPLTPMKLNIQYLQKIKGEGSPNFDAYFESASNTLIRQIETLSAIASSFSDFARMPVSTIEPVEIKDLVDEVVSLFMVSDEYAIVRSYDETLTCFVLCDRDQLRRALVNLLKNATQAVQNQKNGTILVDLTHMDQNVRISFSDNGPGVNSTDQGKLFEPNFTTKSGGTGLGLAISKRIVENFKGDIGFRSVPGNTTFYIDLPVA